MVVVQHFVIDLCEVRSFYNGSSEFEKSFVKNAIPGVSRRRANCSTCIGREDDGPCIACYLVAFAEVNVCNGGGEFVEDCPICRSRGGPVKGSGDEFAYSKAVSVLEWTGEVGNELH